MKPGVKELGNLQEFRTWPFNILRRMKLLKLKATTVAFILMKANIICKQHIFRTASKYPPEAAPIPNICVVAVTTGHNLGL